MEISLLTDVGQKRTNNQDYVNHYVNRAGRTMIILADGMGGHRAGNIASEMAVTDLGVAWVDTQIDTVNEVREWFANNLEMENKKINQLGQDEAYKGMGTTLVIAIKTDDYILYGNIGDSSGYVVKNEKLHKVTKDHTLVNLLVSTGELTPEQAKFHPRKNLLTRALGANDPIEIDIFDIDNTINGLFLCSDGLTNMVTDEQIEKVLNSKSSIEEQVEKLIKKSNIRGGTDNISIAYLKKESGDK